MIIKIPIGHELFNAVRNLYKHTNDRDCKHRRELCCIYLYDNKMVATDGKSLIEYTINWKKILPDIPEGTYMPHKNDDNKIYFLEREEGFIYPNYKNVIQDIKGRKSFEIDCRFTESLNMQFLLYEIAQQNVFINVNIFNRLPELRYTMYIGGPEDPLLFENKEAGILAIIMPLAHYEICAKRL